MIEITRAKGGKQERKVPLDQIQVPDLWHIAMWLRKNQPEMRQSLTIGSEPIPIHEVVLECWHLCSDLLRHIGEQGK